MTCDQLPEQWREWHEERAAIREYDGGMTREEAEAAALAEVVSDMLLELMAKVALAG